MVAPNDARLFEQLVQKLASHSRLRRSWPLTGGVSAEVTALEIERPDGTTTRLVVRRHGATDLRRNPQIAADEFRLLRLLRSAGVAVPAPYYLDQSGELFPTPYLVIEYVEGTTEFAPADVADLARQLAAQLVRIHTLDATTLDLSFLPRQADLYAALLRERPASVDHSLDEGRIRATLEPLWPLPQRNPVVLLHGDFWPGNILWRDGRLAAVIDWEDAAVGDPLADLANARLELLCAFGADAMQVFTEQYQAQAAVDVTALPHWDLCAAFRAIPKIAGWGLDAPAEARVRAGLRSLIAAAFDQLAV